MLSVLKIAKPVASTLLHVSLVALTRLQIFISVSWGLLVWNHVRLVCFLTVRTSVKSVLMNAKSAVFRLRCAPSVILP